ncbi:MAG: metal-dependent hydrolase [Flavobacteriales bacterium]|nr:metal-dependent hydrolase [Flavobacteriales bacterium]
MSPLLHCPPSFRTLDVVSFSLGIPYEHMLGHRGVTHSLAFSAVWASLMMLLFHRGERSRWLWLCLFGCTASHALLDMCTTGGLGCALFAPFSNERYFFPWRPISVSPVEIHSFFGEWGLRVLKSEALWIGLPSAVIFAAAYLLKRRPARD